MNMRTKKYISLLVGLLGLTVSIVVHEFGHFLACKLCGVETPVFSIGFGPVLLAYPIGNTLFQLAALPLGGFVAINEQIFALQPYWQQLFIMIAGIASNIIFAILLLMYITSKGTFKLTSIIQEVLPKSPAAHAGLQVHDRIHAINGNVIQHNEGQSLTENFLGSPGKTMKLTIERNNQYLDIPVSIASHHPIFGDNVGWVGIELATQKIPTKNIFHNTQESLQSTLKAMSKIMTTFSRTSAKKERKNGGLTGPIGILALTSKSFMIGPSFFLVLLAFLNINIAFFNLLPIPLFDGGKILLYTLQAVIGSPLPNSVIDIINTSTLILLLLLLIWLTFKDIKRL